MNKVKPIEIHTERLDLRIPKKEDQYYLWSILKQEKVNKYYQPTPKRFKTREEYQQSLQDWETQQKYFYKKVDNLDKDSNMYTWSIFLKDFNIPIGQITVQPNDNYDDPSIRDIGWFIEPNMQRQGLTYEAANAILDFMFNEVDIDRIETGAAAINSGSWKLMEKLGMERTGIVDSPYLDEQGNYLSKYNYVITKEMYLEKSKHKSK